MNNPTKIELPSHCYVVAINGKLVKIKKGESGYYPQHPREEDLLKYGGAAGLCDALNALLGVNKGVKEAMVMGSYFGFDAPIADPNNYDAEGNYIGE